MVFTESDRLRTHVLRETSGSQLVAPWGPAVQLIILGRLRDAGPTLELGNSDIPVSYYVLLTVLNNCTSKRLC